MDNQNTSFLATENNKAWEFTDISEMICKLPQAQSEHCS